jgi:hypothetical protein
MIIDRWTPCFRLQLCHSVAVCTFAENALMQARAAVAKHGEEDRERA